MPSLTVDGNDILAVRQAAIEAVARARSGGGPTFLECLTYRLRGHYEGDPARYRELSEVQEWKARDPILRLQRYLQENQGVSQEELERVEAQARGKVEEAARFALSSPLPAPEDVNTQVFA